MRSLCVYTLSLASVDDVANPVLNLLMLVRAVEIMVKSHPEHVNVRDQQQCTPLHLAASEGEVEVAKTLLDVVRLLVVYLHEFAKNPMHF